MKKIILILILAVITITAFSQSVGYPYQNLGSTWGNNMQGVNVLKAFYLPKYNDTTTILTLRNDSLGLMFVQKNVFPNKIWLRDSVSTGGHKWTEIGSGGSGGVDQFFELTDVDSAGIQNGDIPYYDAGSGNILFQAQGTVSTGNVYYAIDSLNTPPGGPSTDDVYMVGGAGTGAWSARNYDIATWNGAAWTFIDPTDGDIAVVTSTKKTYKYGSSTWTITGGIPLLVGGNNLSTFLEYGALSNNGVALITNGLRRIVVSSGGTITFNRGSNTFSFPSGRGTVGQVLTTDGAGTTSWSSVSAGGITTVDNGLTLSTATNAQLGGALTANTTISGAFTLLLSPSRTVISAADSISAIATNNVTVGSVGGTLSLLAPTVTGKSSGLSTFGSATKTILHYETGVGDSVLMEMKATGAFLRGISITTNSAYVPLQRNPTDGNLLPKLINLADGTNQVTGVLPIANGGTNNGSLAVTAGGVIYSDGTKLVNVGAGTSGQVLQSNGASAPTWITNAGAYWALSGQSTITNAVITNTNPNGLQYEGAWTGTATGQAAVFWHPSITGSATAVNTENFTGLNMRPTILAGANNQGIFGLTVNGNGLSANAKTNTTRAALRIISPGTGTRAIMFMRDTSQVPLYSYIDNDGSDNLVLNSANGTITANGNIISSGIQTNTTAASSALVAASSGGLTATASELLFAGAAAIAARVYSRGGSAQSIAANSSSSTLIIGTTSVTLGATGTHALLASAVFNPPSLSSTLGAGITNVANVYINGAPTGFTISGLSYSLWNTGNMRTDGRTIGGKGSDVASANDLTLGAGGNTFVITGATQINAITTTSWLSGSHITLIFSSNPTVKNNTAGGANTAVMLLAGGADFSATANDVLNLVYDGTSWYEEGRSVN